MAGGEGDPPWDTPSEEGWTNDYVSDRFAVDGSINRVHAIPRKWRYRIYRLYYELFGAFLYRVIAIGIPRRAEYPLRRVVGRIINRERRAEQAIAEKEYVMAAVLAAGRGGVGSPTWNVAAGVIIGLFLVGVGTGWSFYFLLTDGVAGLAAAVPGFFILIGGFSTLGLGYVVLESTSLMAESE